MTIISKVLFVVLVSFGISFSSEKPSCHKDFSDRIKNANSEEEKNHVLAEYTARFNSRQAARERVALERHEDRKSESSS